MIIVPTEKRFDWQHAPISLFIIVVLNVLVFYAYQTGDSSQFDEALNTYINEGIFLKEVPHYKTYLADLEATEELAMFEELERQSQTLMAAVLMLQDEPFYDYLVENGPELFQPGYYDYWLYQRQWMHDLMHSVSYHKYGLTPSNFQVTDLITHQFLHAGTMHLIGNMFFLIICGFAVEAAIGHRNFFIFYLVTGIAGGLAQSMMDWQSNIPLVGASGAVSGVMAMYLGIFRLKKIEFFYWFFVFVGYFRAPALFILPFYIGKELIDLWSSPESNVAFMAHVGGFVAGALIIAATIWFKPETLNQDYIEADQAANPEQLSMDNIYQSLDKLQFERASQLVNSHVKTYGSNFDLLVLKYKLTQFSTPKEAQPLLAKIIGYPRPNPAQLKKIESIWQGLTAEQQQIDQEAKYKLAWNFLTVPEYIGHAIKLFQELYESENKHPTLNMLAKKISLTYNQLENRIDSEKYLSLAKELS
jgi:membrane associated rhomboid family serine protease